MRHRMELLRADTPNKNGRIYPAEVLKAAIKTYNETHDVENGVLGQADYPTNVEDLGTVDLARVSHRSFRLEYDEDKNAVFCEVEPVPGTVLGTVMTEMLQSGTAVISPAGIGMVDDNGVVSDYQIQTVNFISASQKS